MKDNASFTICSFDVFAIVPSTSRCGKDVAVFECLSWFCHHICDIFPPLPIVVRFLMQSRSFFIFIYFDQYKFGRIVFVLQNIKTTYAFLQGRILSVFQRCPFEVFLSPRFSRDMDVYFMNKKNGNYKLKHRTQKMNGKQEWYVSTYHTSNQRVLS